MGLRERILEYISYKGITVQMFENKANISNGAVSKMGDNTRRKTLDKISNSFPDLNINWLITGVGQMCNDSPEENEVNEVPRINYAKGVPYYNVDFIGGFDIVFNDQNRNPDYYIDFEPYNKPGVIWCNITGHSMEPELNNGDFIAMKEMTDPIEYLPYGEIYGFITNSYRTVKRMGRSDKSGFIRLIPTNKSPEYSDQDIPVNMILKIYAVLGSVHRLF